MSRINVKKNQAQEIITIGITTTITTTAATTKHVRTYSQWLQLLAISAYRFSYMLRILKKNNLSNNTEAIKSRKIGLYATPKDKERF